MITIYRKSGISATPVYSTEINEGSKYRYTLMKEHFIVLRFSTATPVYFELGDYADTEFGRFELVDLYTPQYNRNTGGYDYELRLDSYYWKMKNKLFRFNSQVAGSELSWSLTASLSVHASRIIANLHDIGIKYYDETDYTVAIDPDYDTEAKLITYDQRSILDAITDIANTFECEWWFEDNVIHFGKCEFGSAVSMSVLTNVKDMTSSDSRQEFATRIFAFGSDRNLPHNYRATSPEMTVNGVVQKRLMLPEDTPYLDAETVTREEGAVEGVVIFDDVYPRTQCVVGTVTTYEDSYEDEETGETVTKTYYRVTDTSGLDFSTDYILEGETLHILFQSGYLNGMDFECQYNDSEKYYEIVMNEDYGRELPDETLHPVTGDKFVLYNWDSTKLSSLGLIDAAEHELLTKAQEYLDKTKIDPSVYAVTVTSEYSYNNGTPLLYEMGQKVSLYNPTFFQTERVSRIIGLEFNLDIPYDSPVYSVGESVSVSRIGSIEQDLADITYKGDIYIQNGTGSGVYLIKTTDKGVPATDKNVLSAKNSFLRLLRKDIADAAKGVITFMEGILLGDGSKGITADGDATLNSATLNSLESTNYSGTDIISDKGFKMWEDSEGKSHVIVDYFSARVKAFFASLEVRKIEHTAGNRIESPAGNNIILVKKIGTDGKPIPEKWYARRYSFAGVSWSMPKLVYQAAQFFGLWKSDPSATVSAYRCYWTAEDEEKGVENDWVIGDQALCQTFRLRTQDIHGTAYGVQNKHYWRLVVNKGIEEIDGTEYGFVDLAATLGYIQNVWDAALYPTQEKIYVGYDSSAADIPSDGDDIACVGSQKNSETRGGAIQYVTYGEVDDTTGIPCVKMYSGINSFSPLDNFLIQKQSPKGVFVRADRFEIYSASGTGIHSPATCYRGNWTEGVDYGKNDIVQHKGSTWIYISDTISREEPSDSATRWSIYARRGIGAPQASLDSMNAVVGADYEGKIASISQVSGLPTTIELYVEGEQIQTSAWDKTNSYVKYYDRRIPLNNQMVYFGWGIILDDITVGTDSVTLEWAYNPERHITLEGETIVHPVINPTDILVHLVFDYKGETLSADVSAPMVVQKSAAPMLAEYSQDGANWHSPFQSSDIYAHYSYDGGQTWTSAIRIVGKSIEFDKGIRHFDSYSDLMAYLVSIESAMTDKDMGYYIADTDDGGVPEATLWYFYTESSDPRDIEQVPFPATGELNYLTSYDGHLWNADNTSEFWHDMGMIQGEDGVDGVSIVLDPATVIFEQSQNSPYPVDTSGFVASVKVWQGTSIKSGNFIKGVQGVNCTAHYSGNNVYIDSISQSGGVYYPSGKVNVTVRVNSQDTILTLNWAANLLGTWKMTVENSVMQMVSTQTVNYTKDDGSVESVQWQSAISQNSQRFGLTVKKGELETAGIHLDGENSRIDLLADKTQFLRSSDGLPFIKIGVDEDGMPYLIFLMPDGVTEAYNLGYKGLTNLINEGVPANFSSVLALSLIGFLSDYEEDGISCQTLYNACMNENLPDYYRYNQTRTKQSDGTYIIVPATPNYDGMYYNGNILDDDNQNLPDSSLYTLDEISGALDGDVTLWAQYRSNLSGYDDTLRPPDPYIRIPAVNLHATFRLHYVVGSRIVKSVELVVTRWDDDYFVTENDGMTNETYYPESYTPNNSET